MTTVATVTTDMSQDEIIRSTKVVIQGLDALRHEHNQVNRRSHFSVSFPALPCPPPFCTTVQLVLSAACTTHIAEAICSYCRADLSNIILFQLLNEVTSQLSLKSAETGGAEDDTLTALRKSLENVELGVSEAQVYTLPRPRDSSLPPGKPELMWQGSAAWGCS